MITGKSIGNGRCVKTVRIWSFSAPHFPTFGLNMEWYGVYLGIQSEYVKLRTRKTPNTDIFDGVRIFKTMYPFSAWCQLKGSYSDKVTHSGSLKIFF